MKESKTKLRERKKGRIREKSCLKILERAILPREERRKGEARAGGSFPNRP